MFLHRVLEFTAGGIFLIAIPLWVEQFIKFGKSRFVHPNAGYGALFMLSNSFWLMLAVKYFL